MKRSSYLTIILAVSAALAACHDRPSIPKRSPDRGGAHPVGRELIAAPGVVEPKGGEVRLAALEAGVLREVLAKEGDLVRAGDALARLEDSAASHDVLVAEADVRRARAELARTAPGAEEVRVAKANAQAALLSEEQERRDAARAEVLGASGTIAWSELERRRSVLSITQAGSEAARAELALAERGARAPEKELAQAQLGVAQARLAGARAALARREVRAPADGVVLWSRYHAGEFYAPSAGPLLVLGAPEQLQVRLEFDDVDASELVPGTHCELRDDGGTPLGAGPLVRLAPEYASRSLTSERPTDRGDARVREGFVELAAARELSSGRRVWAYCRRAERHPTG